MRSIDLSPPSQGKEVVNRTHKVLLLAFLALSSFFLWSKIDKAEKMNAEYQGARYFPNLEDTNVESIKVVSLKPAYEYELRRFGDQWFIDSHLLNVEKAYQLVSSLLELSREREMDPAPSAQGTAQFQLDMPAYQIEVFGPGGKSLGGVKLGKRTPDFNHFYGQAVSGGPISTVPAYTLGVLEDKPQDLRENALFATEVEAVKKLAIGDGKESKILLQRKGESDFFFEAPGTAKADESLVKGFLTQLKDMKVGRFLAPDEEADFGDLAIQYVAQVTYSDSEVVTELYQRVPVKLALVYGRRYLRKLDGGDLVEGTAERFVIEISTGSRVLEVKAGNFEDRRVLVFDLDDVKSLKVEGHQKVFAASKDGMGKWKLDAENHDSQSAPENADGLVWLLKDLRFEEFAGDLGEAESSELMIELKFKSHPKAQLGFGMAENGKPYLWRNSKAYNLTERSWNSLSEKSFRALGIDQKAMPESIETTR